MNKKEEYDDAIERGEDVKKEIKLVGQPKLVREKVITEGRNRYGNSAEEIRSQLIMAIPSNLFKSESEKKYFFEEAICAEINRIHKEQVHLEVTGRVGDLLAQTRCTGNNYTAHFRITDFFRWGL